MSKKMSKKARVARALRSRKTMKMVYGLTGAFAFLSTFTGKDRAQYTGSWMDKGKTLVNNLGGRLLGVNAFDSAPTFPQITGINTSGFDTDPTIKISAGLVGYGIASGLIRKIPIAGRYVKLPHAGKIGRIGGVALGASILGKLLDAPTVGGATAYTYIQSPAAVGGGILH